MQYPDDFLKNNSVQGRGDKRELDKTDSPYLVRFGPDGVTRKKDRFTVFTPEPAVESQLDLYLYGALHLLEQGTGAEGVARISANPDASLSRKVLSVGYSIPFEWVLPPPNDGLRLISRLTRHPYVGDNYVIRVMSSGNAVIDVPGGVSVIQPFYWVTMIRADVQRKEILSANNPSAGQSVSFIDKCIFDFDAQLAFDYTNVSIVPTGFDESTGGYKFVVMIHLIQNQFRELLLIGDTKEKTLTQSSLPAHEGEFVGISYGGRSHLFPLWKGAIQGFTQTPLTLVTSLDHGQTWSSEAWGDDTIATTLGPLEDILIVYLGDGKSIIIGKGDYVTTEGHLPTHAFVRMYLGQNGTGYSQISTPADTWQVDVLNSPFPPGDVILIYGTSTSFGTRQDYIKCAHYSFGVGCMYLPVMQSGQFKIMFTHDFGTTWSFSDEVPNEIVEDRPNDYPTFSATIVRPYINSQRKGVLIFAYPDYVKNRIVFLKTDGTFSKFTRVGSVSGSRKSEESGAISGLYPDDDAYGQNYTFTNYSRYVYPAFPREFDRP